MLSVGVPDDPEESVLVELARLTAGPVQVYKDGDEYVQFEYVAFDYPDQPMPGYSVGFVDQNAS